MRRAGGGLLQEHNVSFDQLIPQRISKWEYFMRNASTTQMKNNHDDITDSRSLREAEFLGYSRYILETDKDSTVIGKSAYILQLEQWEAVLRDYAYLLGDGAESSFRLKDCLLYTSPSPRD